jgi:simple sugar transport system substrate-binding protein
VETTKATDGGKVYFIDVIGDKTSIDKGFLLSSVIWDLKPVYVAMINDIKADKFGTHNYDIKLSDDSVKLLKTKSIPDDVWTSIMALRADIVGGKLKVTPHFDADSVHKLVKPVQ